MNKTFQLGHYIYSRFAHVASNEENVLKIYIYIYMCICAEVGLVL